MIHWFVATVIVALVAGTAALLVHELRGRNELQQRSHARAEAELRGVFAAMRDIVMVLGRDGEYLEVPTTAAQGLYAPTSDLPGRTVRDVLPGAAAEEVMRVIQQALASAEPVRYEYMLPVGGTPTWFSACVTPLDHDAVVWVARDVTENHRLTEQLLESRKLEAVGILAGGVAHDFNNILTVIGAHASFLLDSLADSDPRREDAGEIVRSTQRAAALTDQLLAVGRKQMLKPVAVDVNDVITAMANGLRPVLNANVEVRVRRSDARPTVLMDPARLEQVLTNLARNAGDAMPDGGVLTFAVAVEQLDDLGASARGLAAGWHVRITVADTGAGMNADVLGHVFEPFFTTKGLGRGSGLGLSTVHGIVRQSGGHVSVASRPGEGATFEILLPMVSAARLDPARREPRGAGGNETVLIAEDEAGVRAAARRVLTKHGYRVLEAMDGVDALRIALQSDEPIDLLLTDCVMPRVNGAELARELSAARPGIAVLFMSGYTEDAIVRSNLKTGGSRMIEKPFTGARLAQAVRDALDARASVATHAVA